MGAGESAMVADGIVVRHAHRNLASHGVAEEDRLAGIDRSASSKRVDRDGRALLGSRKGE
jgi:hypothetical protein